MAYIYSKNSGHCLIIGPQEFLIYPFNFGNFQEVRWGGFFSVVSGGSGNFNTVYPGWTGNFSGPLTQLYMGFKDTGTLMPGIGSSFVGISKTLSSTANGISSANLCFSSTTSPGGNYQTIDSTGGAIYFSTQTQNPISITTATGDVNFASFWGITLGIQNNVFSGMAIYDTAFYTDVSTGNLSRLVNNPPNISPFSTGYYTTGNLNNLNLLQFPQAIYIYFPFLNNQLRIHALDIEQFN